MLRLSLAALLCLALPFPARADPVDIRVAASGGYDQDVLGRPGDKRNTASIGDEGFVRLSPSLVERLRSGRWRFSGGYQYTFNRYGSDAAGLYHDHSAWVLGRYGLSSRVGLLLDGSGGIFRRTEYTDSNLDRLEGGGRVEYLVNPDWALDGGVFVNRNHYADRTVGTDHQSDDGHEVEAGVTGRLSEKCRLSLTGGRIVNGSNEETSRYDGWTGSSLLSWRAPVLFDLALGGQFEHRDYDTNPASTAASGTNPRRDRLAVVSIDVARRLAPRLRTFGRMSYLDYHSTVDGYSYNAATASAGIEWSFGSGRSKAPSGGTVAAPARDLAPVVRGTSVRFRYRSKTAASVSVAGSFNGWKTGDLSLSDPGKDGLWEIDVLLPPGLHRYMFFVDGKDWVTPEDAPYYEDDGFGTRNGILEIH